MKIYKSAALYLSLAFLSIVSPAWATGCFYEKVFNGVEGEKIAISIPSNQLCAIGTYKIFITKPGQKPQIIYMQRSGFLSDSWFVDLNADQSPEIITWVQSVGRNSYGKLAIFEKSNGKYVSRRVAPLKPSQKRGYAGHDKFSIENNSILLQFPVVATNNFKRFKYSLIEKNWQEVFSE